MKLALVALPLLVLAGCQSADMSPAQFSASYQGKPVQYFMDRNPDFSPVSASDTGHNKKRFVFVNNPSVVTTTLPAYTPRGRHYNNAALGSAFNNLNTAVGTVPSVSRTSVQQCQVTVYADYQGPGRTPSAWKITSVVLGGTC